VHGRSGVILSRHEYAESWQLMRTPDQRVHLQVPEMLQELRALRSEPAAPAAPAAPADGASLLLMAGERRAYNANQIFRSPDWRKTDAEGALRMHPDDLRRLGLAEGGRARCRRRRTTSTCTCRSKPWPTPRASPGAPRRTEAH